jgi:protein ImuB
MTFSRDRGGEYRNYGPSRRRGQPAESAGDRRRAVCTTLNADTAGTTPQNRGTLRAEPDRIRPLLALKMHEIDAGFGIDAIRIHAHVTEPVHAQQHRGHLDAEAAAIARQGADTALDDLIGKVGARIGLEAIVRLHPADSHIPEKTSKVVAAAWSESATDWPVPPVPRPLVLWRPEPVQAEDRPALPLRFRWRRREMVPVGTTGPERIAPEWWLDEPDWRSGTRDYWRSRVESGECLWLNHAQGGTRSSGWFCQGAFA